MALPTGRLDLTHLRYLTDDFGIWQHTAGRTIDYAHGYALDDSARALIAAAAYGATDLMEVYFQFLVRAVGRPDYQIINFFDYERQPRPLAWSEDALAQAYWAFATCVAIGWRAEEARGYAAALEPIIRDFRCLRGYAYAGIAAELLQSPLVPILAERLLAQTTNLSEAWPWPEETLTYANAIVPWALLRLAPVTAHQQATQAIALRILLFLNQVCTHEGTPMAIGNKGWYPRNGPKALFDQQGIDVAYQVLANSEAYRQTGDEVFLQESQKFFSWFWGNNVLGVLMVDPEDQSVLDGLQATGPDQNRGAEGIVCYLWAQEKVPSTAYKVQSTAKNQVELL